MPPVARWSTVKLGFVVSTLAAIVAVVLDATTSVPADGIVLGVVVVAFALSWWATARRSVANR